MKPSFMMILLKLRIENIINGKWKMDNGKWKILQNYPLSTVHFPFKKYSLIWLVKH